MKVRLEAKVTRGFVLSPHRFRDSLLPLRGLLFISDLSRRNIKKNLWDQGTSRPLYIFNLADISHRVSAQKRIFPIFLCAENHMTKACVHGFIRYCPSYCRAFTANLMGLPLVKLEARTERSGLLLTILTDSTYRTNKYCSTNSGRTFPLTQAPKLKVIFVFLFLVCKITLFTQRVLA